MEDGTAFGQALRAARRAAGKSAQQVADGTDGLVSRGMIANWESGRKEGVDVRELIAVARALAVSPMSLLYPLGELDVQDALWFAGYDDADYRLLYRYADANKAMKSLDYLPESMHEHVRKTFQDAKEALDGKAKG